jgi:hypothetical protein
LKWWWLRWLLLFIILIIIIIIIIIIVIIVIIISSRRVHQLSLSLSAFHFFFFFHLLEPLLATFFLLDLELALSLDFFQRFRAAPRNALLLFAEQRNAISIRIVARRFRVRQQRAQSRDLKQDEGEAQQSVERLDKVHDELEFVVFAVVDERILDGVILDARPAMNKLK